MKSRYHKTEGIILKSVKFGEGHKIINIYTKELGKIEATAFGARKPKSKLANKTQLFNYARFLLYRSNIKENEPYAVKEIEVLKYFNGVKQDYSRYIAANYTVEPILKLIGREQRDIGIFNLVLKTFYTLEIIDIKKIVYLLLMYSVKFLSSMGYRFNLNKCSLCNKELDTKDIFVDSYKGFPLCASCRTENSLKLTEGAKNFMNWAQDEDVYKSIKVTMSKNTLNNIKAVLSKIYEFIFNASLEGWKYINNLET